MTYQRSSMIRKTYMLFLWLSICELQVFVQNETYVYKYEIRRKLKSHLTFQRWSKTTCRDRVMVQWLRGSFILPPRFKRLQAWLLRFVVRCGTLGDPFVLQSFLSLIIIVYKCNVMFCDCMYGFI